MGNHMLAAHRMLLLMTLLWKFWLLTKADDNKVQGWGNAYAMSRAGVRPARLLSADVNWPFTLATHASTNNCLEKQQHQDIPYSPPYLRAVFCCIDNAAADNVVTVLIHNLPL